MAQNRRSAKAQSRTLFGSDSNWRPGHADHRLLVADKTIAPSEKVKQLPIAPEIMPVLAFSATGFNDQSTHEWIFGDQALSGTPLPDLATTLSAGTHSPVFHASTVSTPITEG
jgi:hypothetical protein